MIKLLYILGLFWTVHASYAQEQDKNDFRITFQSIEWAPDGNSIAFTAIKVKKDWSDYAVDKWTLFTYNISSGKLEVVDIGSTFISFSPDGKSLAYDKTVDKNTDIYLMDIAKGISTKLIDIDSDSKAKGPSWSPNGKFITFYSDMDGHEEIYTYDLKIDKVSRITWNEEYKSYNPVWSPKSNLILYYLEKGDSKDQIYLTDSKGSYQKNLTDDDHHNIFPSWTPDGKIIYLRDKGEIMIMEKDGKGKKQLIEGVAGQVRMSPDGKSLLISNSQEGTLSKYNLSTREITKLLDSTQLFN